MAWGSPPTNVRWERTGGRNMVLKWNAVAGARSYGIQVQYGGSHGRMELRWRNIRKTQFKISNWGSNLGYRFRVWASSSDGWTQSQNSIYSAWTPWFYTPPVQPRDLRVSVGASGASLSWSRNGSYYRSGTEVACSDGRSWLLGNGTHGAAPTTFTDVDASGVGLTYRVRGFVGAESPAGRRVFGPWTAWSAPVDSLVAPDAPEVTSPVGVSAFGGSTRFEWVPAPRDGTAQTGAQVRYREQGSSAWVTETVTGAAASVDVHGLAVGVFETQVRTKALSGEYGAWSAVSLFTVANRPTVTVTSLPTDSSVLTVAWQFVQAQGLPQSRARVVLLQEGQVLESRTANGPMSSTTFDYVLTNATAYMVRVTAWSGNLASTTTSRSFTTVFIPPTAPVLSGVWDESNGVHVLSVAPGSGGDKPTSHMSLYRDDVDGRVLVEGNITSSRDVWDYDGNSGGSTSYTLVAVSPEDAMSETAVIVEANSPTVWLRDSEMRTVRLMHNPSWTETPSKPDRDFIYFDGRDKPVVFEGDATERTLQVSGLFLPERMTDFEWTGDARRLLAEFGSAGGLVTVRTPDNTYIRGALTNVSIPTETNGLSRVSFTVREAN